MKHIRAMLLGAAVITGATSLASAQAVVPVQWGWGQRDNDDRQAFREGFQQGQWDARHNHGFNPNNNRWRERDDRDAYRRGYERGFRDSGSYGGYSGRDRDADYRGGYGRGGYGYDGGSAARQYGYQDGLNDGQRDRQTGHSNRPTEGSNFRHADRGYSSRYGNKDYYKQAYREAYQSGYEQGYGFGGGIYRRRY